MSSTLLARPRTRATPRIHKPDPLHARLEVIGDTLAEIRRTLRIIAERLDAIEVSLVEIKVPEAPPRLRRSAS